jgi:hypothetical protein
MTPVLKKHFALFPRPGLDCDSRCAHPDKDEELVRYYGYYSNVSRGKRKKQKPEEKTGITTVTLTGAVMTEHLLAPRVSAHTLYVPLLARRYLWLP